MPPPLLGYNNNVRHRGRIFHIQTEDSGLQYPRIMTHLFADGGRIVKSTRTDYAEHIGRDDWADVVRGLMKEQHKAMFVALRCGELDAIIGFEADAPPASLSSRGVKQQAEELAKSSRASVTNEAQSTPSQSTPEVLPPAPSAAEAARKDARSSSAGFPAVTKPASDSEQAAASSAADLARTYAAPRPASIFAEAPQVGESLFGESTGGEKSLDEAILSYLSEDEAEKDD